MEKSPFNLLIINPVEIEIPKPSSTTYNIYEKLREVDSKFIEIDIPPKRK